MAPSQQIYDIQSDMARHDEEGSGGYRDEEDDYEDHNIGGSGDGSGYGNYVQDFIIIFVVGWVMCFFCRTSEPSLVILDPKYRMSEQNLFLSEEINFSSNSRRQCVKNLKYFLRIIVRCKRHRTIVKISAL